MKKPNLVFSLIAVLSIAAFSGVGFISTIQAENSVKSESSVSEQSASYSIERMTCATCPITVRKAMTGVEGVNGVSVDFETKIATVAFNPEITTIEIIGAASTNAGYPATLIEVLEDS